MISVSYIFLQMGSGNAGMTNLIFFGAMILIFWLFFIRPQTKKQKEQSNFLEALQKGDEVVTTSGMLGKINKIEENIVTLEVGTKTFIRVTKNAVSKDLTSSIYGASN